MKYIFQGFGILFRQIAQYRKYLPASTAGLFLLITFVYDFIRSGFVFAFAKLSKSIFATELVINQRVHKALAGIEKFGISDIIVIIFSIMILYLLVRGIAKILVWVTGSQAIAGAYLVAIVIVFIIQISAVKVIDGSFGFIPFYDGIIFLFKNLPYMFSNFHFFN